MSELATAVYSEGGHGVIAAMLLRA